MRSPPSVSSHSSTPEPIRHAHTQWIRQQPQGPPDANALVIDLYAQIETLNARLAFALQEKDKMAKERDRWQSDFLAADAERQWALEKLQLSGLLVPRAAVRNLGYSRSASCWSRLPPELTTEIAGHNHGDVYALRAMCLVSKALRLSAIEYLFSTIHFTSEADFHRWHDMLCRTPKLQTVPKKTKFSHKGWDRYCSHWKVKTQTELHGVPVPPQIPAMPSVRVVEWDADSVEISMAVAYIALFPNIQELHLKNIGFSDFDELAELLGACGAGLRVLSFNNVDVGEEIYADPDSPYPPYNLTVLEDLTATYGGPEYHRGEYLVPLLEASRPGVLRSLTLRSLSLDDPVAHAEKLLRLAAPYLVNLVLRLKTNGNAITMGLFRGLPAFSCLKTLTISLGFGREAAQVLDTMTAAPSLTALIFLIDLTHTHESETRTVLQEILEAAFPWSHASESMKTILTRKFPLVRRVAFHFCVTDYFREGVRRKMVWQLMNRLRETGADLAAYIEVQWLDEREDRYRSLLGRERVPMIEPDWIKHPSLYEPETDSDRESDHSFDWDE
ncbi:hypothetical protein DFH06DRAFT_182401 [Mycena polygramma]|nr:hypothetical protein DFH06DRAFT_182401 [Mycena polygramma]